MYQRMQCICTPPNGASGPRIGSETFFKHPDLQDDCIDYLTFVSGEKFSRYISGLMDHLGYSYGMIKERQQLHRERDAQYFTIVPTGSKSEGTTLLLESDFDYMFVFKNVICADNLQHVTYEWNETLFQMERQETSPGYTRLRLMRDDGALTDYFRQSMFSSETGSFYVSSQFFNETNTNLKKILRVNPDYTTVKDPKGPSSPLSCIYTDEDHVYCFRCFCPDILNRWVSRLRNHEWPSQDLIHEVSVLEGHVVPVGNRGSENMYREWRICYTLAELHLIRSLNETQLKVYILLKSICKSALNPVCEEMTSYIMKNVVFWLCEAKGLRMFLQHKLIDRLLDSIHYLRACITKGNLPSYMIPEEISFYM